MNTFPPVGDKLIDNSNRTRFPQTRWVLQHTRELVPTRNIRRGAAPPSTLPRAERNLGATVFEDDKGQKISVEQWLDSTYTDALVVMHKGRIVYERYLNGMKPETPHLLFSVTKSFTGLLAAQLAADGRIDREALVTAYVPELADSAWGDMKVKDMMDMTGAVRYREVYTDPTTEVFPYLYSSNLLPPPAGYAGRRTSTTFSRH